MLSLVVPDADEAAGRSEGVPGDVKPGGGGEELVGILARLQERDEALELGWVAGANVGGLADEVLGVADAADSVVDELRAVAGVDEDRANLKAGRLQQHQAAIGHVGNGLHRRYIFRVFL